MFVLIATVDPVILTLRYEKAKEAGKIQLIGPGTYFSRIQPFGGTPEHLSIQ